MKRFYQSMEVTPLHMACEGSILSASSEPVQEIELQVEVDDYITIDNINISFD